VGFRAERGESRCCALTKVTEVASLIVHNEIDKTGTLFGAYCWVSRVERKTLINMQRGDFQHAGMMSRARVQQSPKYNRQPWTVLSCVPMHIFTATAGLENRAGKLLAALVAQQRTNAMFQ